MKLTDRNLEVAYEINKFIGKKKRSPSVTEIGKAVNIKGRNGVYTHLKRLRDNGIISWEEGESGTIQVLQPEKVAEEHAARVKAKQEDYIY